MGSDSSRQWALLIGIDQYPGFGSDVQLEGCVNDVEIMEKALVERFGFPAEQITVLLNEQATRAGILAAMEDLVQKAGRDHNVVFHYSGHGSQMPEADGRRDEPDGWDETIVPFDSDRYPRENRDIVDDEIHDWLVRLNAKTPYVTLIIDACNSGTIVRDAFGGKVRQVPRETRRRRESRPASRTVSFRDAGEEGPSGWLPRGESYVLLAACASAENANEIVLSGTEPVVYGALTYFLVQELMAPGFSGATCWELLERVAPRIRAQFPTQSMQVEGARHREIFGAKEIRPMPFVSIRERQDHQVVLEAGKVCGVMDSSEWLVYSRGTRSLSQNPSPIGRVTVTSVGVTTSAGRLIEESEPGIIDAGARAVETVHCLKNAELKVEILAPPDLRRALAEMRLTREERMPRRIVEAGAGEKAEARVYLLGPRESASDRDPAPMLENLEEESWVAVAEDGSLLGPPLPRRCPKSLEILLENLESAARCRAVVDLSNPGSPLDGRIHFTVQRLEAGNCVPPERDRDGRMVFQVDDQIVLKVRNDSEAPLYVYVLDVGLTGKVTPVYPDPGACKPLEAGFSIKVGMDGLLKLFMPEDFPLLHRRGKDGRLEGWETLKLFASTSPADFHVLENNGYRFRGSGSLREVLDAAFGGGEGLVYRAFHTGEDWTTLQQSFLLRAR